MGVILTTYDTRDDPPSRMDHTKTIVSCDGIFFCFKSSSRCKSGLFKKSKANLDEGLSLIICPIPNAQCINLWCIYLHENPQNYPRPYIEYLGMEFPFIAGQNKHSIIEEQFGNLPKHMSSVSKKFLIPKSS